MLHRPTQRRVSVRAKAKQNLPNEMIPQNLDNQKNSALLHPLQTHG